MSYYVQQVKARLDDLFAALAKEGVTDNESYAEKFHPEDNDHYVNLEAIAIWPVFPLLEVLADHWEAYYDADIVVSEAPADRERTAIIARTFDLKPEQLADIYRLSAVPTPDTFGCRDRLLAYLDQL